LIPLHHNNHLLHKNKCVLNKVDAIPLTPRKGTRGRVIGTSRSKVIKATRVLHLMPLRVLNLISQPSNREVIPRRTRIFI